MEKWNQQTNNLVHIHKESIMNKNEIKTAALTTLRQALVNVKGNTDLVAQALPTVTETTDQLAILVEAEKMASKVIAKVEKKAAKLASKPAKERKPRAKKVKADVAEATEAPVTAEA